MSDDADLDALLRYAADESDVAERLRVEAWLASDARNAAVLRAIRGIVGERHEMAPEFDVRAAWARMERAIRPRESGIRVRARRRAPDLAFPRTLPAHRGVTAGIIAAAVAIAALLVWHPVAQLRRSGLAAQPMRVVSTTVGQRAELELDDGTRVSLSAESRLRYPVAFGDRSRTVELDGEAYFDVVHDAGRPFVVRTAGSVVRDVGTAFGVRQYRADAPVQVVVASGRVDVSAAADTTRPQLVDAGHRARIAHDGRTVIDSVDVGAYLAWRDGRLAFDDTPFADVLTQLTRWYDADFVVQDSALAGRRFTGAFDTGSLDSVLDLLAPALHARYERRGRTIRFFPLPDGR